MHIARLRLHAQRIFQVNEKRLFSVIRGCFAGRAVRQFNHFDYQTPFTRARLQKLGENTYCRIIMLMTGLEPALDVLLRKCAGDAPQPERVHDRLRQKSQN